MSEAPTRERAGSASQWREAGGRLRRFAARVDLKTRLSLFIGLLLGVVLLLAMLAVLGNSRRAVRGEIDAVMKLTAALLDESTAAQSQTGGEGAPTAILPILPGLLAVLDHTRHLCVEIGSAPTVPGERSCPAAVHDEVPDWFVAHVTTAPREMRRLMLDASGKAVPVIIRADPADEILEAWREAKPLLLLIITIGFLTNAVVVFSVWRAFQPIELIREALARIGRGELHPGLPQASTPELRSIIEGMAELGANLERARSDNRRLLRHSLEVQEQERRAIARELHDDIGQSLAAMDADAALLQQGGAGSEAERRLRVLGIRKGIATVYDGLHALLARLRPAGLDEFGLGSALQNLAADWSGRCPWIRFEARIEIEKLAGEPLVQVYLYRIAQEALTNAVRHSGARCISLMLGIDADGAVHLRIADDGRGLPDDLSAGGGARSGLGLLGIAERAEMLGAQLSLGRPDGGRGTCISLSLPPVAACPVRRLSHPAVT
ncbi:MAG: histidine kinase [Nevskia sp.]